MVRANVVCSDPKTTPRAEAEKAFLSEGRLRLFRPDDIPVTASFHDRIFEGGDGSPSNRLCEYFEELFFHNPWADPLVQSCAADTGCLSSRVMTDSDAATGEPSGQETGSKRTVVV